MHLQAGNKVAAMCLGSVLPDAGDAALVRQYFADHYQLEMILDEHIYQWQPARRRAELLLDYLQHDDVAMIWALRGGEGSADLIPYLEQAQTKLQLLPQKILAGFSDITALLVYFAQQYGWSTIHGPGAVQMAKETITQQTKRTMMDLLFGKIQQLTFTELQAYNESAKNPHNLAGQVTGGNLSLLNISIQDSWEVEFANKIIMIEDVNEKAHALVRTLKYFQRIGKFNNCQALILGDFLGDQQQDAAAITRVLQFFAENCEFPVFKTDQFGHGKVNLPFVFNKKAQLHCGDRARLVIQL